MPSEASKCSEYDRRVGKLAGNCTDFECTLANVIILPHYLFDRLPSNAVEYKATILVEVGLSFSNIGRRSVLQRITEATSIVSQSGDPGPPSQVPYTYFNSILSTSDHKRGSFSVSCFGTI